MMVVALLLATAANAQQDEQAEPEATDGETLRLLPENNRYFEYKGLPMVLFGHQGGLSPTPDATFPASVVAEASRYGNSLFVAMHPQWVRASHEELLANLQNDEHWENLEEIARTAHQHDVILHVYFWSYLWDYGSQDFVGSDMVWPEPDEDGGEVVDGWTRRDLHELAIDRVLGATWQYPNVVYNFMWEYNTRRDPGRRPHQDAHDGEGELHRWWVSQVRQVGNSLDPTIDHLISISEGRALPGDEEADFESEHSPDFVIDEDGNGFWYACETGHEDVLDLDVPLVFISSDYPFADNDFSHWGNVPFCPRQREAGSTSDYRIVPEDVRNMLQGGFHPAEAWAPAQEDALEYYLQARWYMENVGVLDRSLTDAIKDVPPYRPSARPELVEPEGYVRGRDGGTYAAVYRHPEGLAPAQAEVWVDVDGDGRFNSDPQAGERFEMLPQEGGDYRDGILFTTEGPREGSYVFRFADRNWNPPLSGGLVPGVVEGISYDHWGGE